MGGGDEEGSVHAVSQWIKSSASYQFTMYDDARCSVCAFRPTTELLTFQCDASLQYLLIGQVVLLQKFLSIANNEWIHQA